MIDDASRTHLVLIPSYDSGPLLAASVREARAHWNPVWVVIDGSTDGSEQAVERMARDDAGLRVLKLAANGGKACWPRARPATRMRWRWMPTASIQAKRSAVSWLCRSSIRRR